MKSSMTHTAAKPGMTLGDLRWLIESTSAEPATATLKVRLYMNQGIKSITVETDDDK